MTIMLVGQKLCSFSKQDIIALTEGIRSDQKTALSDTVDKSHYTHTAIEQPLVHLLFLLSPYPVAALA